MQQPDRAIADALPRMAIYAGDVALYCDRIEHAETADADLLLEVAQGLREMAIVLADGLALDLVSAYARRIGEVELRRPIGAASDFDGGAAASRARTWQELQVVQIRHDLDYHPDVLGLSRADQVRHCALHLSKLAAWLARARTSSSAREEVVERRLADTLVFALKLSTLADETLAAAPLPVGSSSARVVSEFPVFRIANG